MVCRLGVRELQHVQRNIFDERFHLVLVLDDCRVVQERGRADGNEGSECTTEECRRGKSVQQFYTVHWLTRASLFAVFQGLYQCVIYVFKRDLLLFNPAMVRKGQHMIVHVRTSLIRNLFPLC